MDGVDVSQGRKYDTVLNNMRLDMFDVLISRFQYYPILTFY